jgi:osmotically-inducible protein OsmY
MRILAHALCTALIGSALLAAGCNKTEGQGTTRTTSGEPAKPADNTGVNERDKGGATMLPTDQAENPTDRDITAGIRKQVVGDDNLSMQAKNVKIITTGQVVTLRGPVKTEAEKKAIGEYAARAANVKRVDNQLEVETK